MRGDWTLLLPQASQSSLTAPEGEAGTCEQAISVLYLPLFPTQGQVVMVHASGRAVPGASWMRPSGGGWCCPGVSRLCRCLPLPLICSSPSQGWHRALAPWRSGPNTSTSMGIPPPPCDPPFVFQLGILISLLLIQTPCLSPLSLSGAPGHQSSQPAHQGGRHRWSESAGFPGGGYRCNCPLLAALPRATPATRTRTSLPSPTLPQVLLTQRCQLYLWGFTHY